MSLKMVIKALTTGTDQASVRNPWNKTLLSYFHTWSPGNALKPIGTFNTEQGIVCFRCIATILNILFLWQWPQICNFQPFIMAIFSQADCMPTWPASVVMWRQTDSISLQFYPALDATKSISNGHKITSSFHVFAIILIVSPPPTPDFPGVTLM